MSAAEDIRCETCSLPLADHTLRMAESCGHAGTAELRDGRVSAADEMSTWIEMGTDGGSYVLSSELAATVAEQLRQSCRLNGHQWDAIMVVSREDPLAFVCTNCGRRVTVAPSDEAGRLRITADLLDYLHRRRDAVARIFDPIHVAAALAAFDDVIEWLDAHGISR